MTEQNGPALRAISIAMWIKRYSAERIAVIGQGIGGKHIPIKNGASR